MTDNGQDQYRVGFVDGVSTALAAVKRTKRDVRARGGKTFRVSRVDNVWAIREIEELLRGLTAEQGERILDVLKA